MTRAPEARRPAAGSPLARAEYTAVDQAKLRWLWLASAGYLVAAGAVAALNVLAPFERGWWLAAYLLLVGAVSQLALGIGACVLARRGQGSALPSGLLRAALALWNVGTGTVAVGDMTQVLPMVDAGSLMLLGALGLLLAPLRAPREATDTTTRALTLAYVLLALGLATSLVIGTALAGALPDR